MKIRIIYVFFLISAILIHIVGLYSGNDLLAKGSRFLFLFPLFGLFWDKFPSKRINLYGFLLCAILANFVTFVGEGWYSSHLSLGLWLAAFVFLVKEALQYTAYTRGSKYTLLYFLLVIGIYIYLFSIHIREIGENLNDEVLFSLYVMYYINLLVLGVTALVYYLNSFSKKSVFFISLALAFILSDVLRDMKVFYFKDTSVEIVSGLIRFAALLFVFKFFATKEKKLRLLNLV